MAKSPIPSRQAAVLEAAIQAKGDQYAHVTVAARGRQLYILSSGDKVARLTALQGDTFGLAFLSHTGRWEPMPFVDRLEAMADIIIDTLGPYLR